MIIKEITKNLKIFYKPLFFNGLNIGLCNNFYGKYARFSPYDNIKYTVKNIKKKSENHDYVLVFLEIDKDYTEVLENTINCYFSINGKPPFMNFSLDRIYNEKYNMIFSNLRFSLENKLNINSGSYLSIAKFEYFKVVFSHFNLITKKKRLSDKSILEQYCKNNCHQNIIAFADTNVKKDEDFFDMGNCLDIHKFHYPHLNIPTISNIINHKKHINRSICPDRLFSNMCFKHYSLDGFKTSKNYNRYVSSHLNISTLFYYHDMKK